MARFKLPPWLIAGGAIVGGWIAYKSLTIDHDMPIGPAIDASRESFHGANSTLMSYYSDLDTPGRPLVLIHSINAAANAYEVRPLFKHYELERPVFALDLPGFGFSERTNREYSIELYVNAITDFLEQVVGEPADVLALSLTSEFAAIAATQDPDLFHSLTFISPTGLTPSMAKRASQTAQENDQSDGVYKFLSNPVWSQQLYDLLVTKPGIRFFLGLNFYGEPDEGLLEYHYRSTHQPNARYAPLTFVSGGLFTPDIADSTYKHLTMPVLVLYDEDPNINFDLLPDILNSNEMWRARRILNTRGLPQFERLDMTVAALNDFWNEIE